MSSLWHTYKTYGDLAEIETYESEDVVNKPKHYLSHPSGVEAIQITEHENFCIGNCFKYLMRRKHKGRELEDLKKASWYLLREIERLEGKQ